MNGKVTEQATIDYSTFSPRGLVIQYDALSAARDHLMAERGQLSAHHCTGSEVMQRNLRELHAIERKWNLCRAEVLRRVEVADEHVRTTGEE